MEHRESQQHVEPDEDTPESVHRYVRLEAPCSLPGGYVLYASCGEQVFPVEVPHEGVETGQLFEGSVLSKKQRSENPCYCQQQCENGDDGRVRLAYRATEPTGARKSSIYQNNNLLVLETPDSKTQSPPRRRFNDWNDGILDCFSKGWCHPTVLNACFCPQLLLAQLLHRLDWKWADLVASSTHPVFLQRLFCQKKQASAATQKRRMLLWFGLLFAMEMVLTHHAASFSHNQSIASPTTAVAQSQQQQEYPHPHEQPTLMDYIIWNEILCIILSIPLTLYSVYVVCRLRGRIRQKYHIERGSSNLLCSDQCEDCLAVACCYSCSMAQMARQTQEPPPSETLLLLSDSESPDSHHFHDVETGRSFSSSLLPPQARCCTKNGLDSTERLELCEALS